MNSVGCPLPAFHGRSMASITKKRGEVGKHCIIALPARESGSQSGGHRVSLNWARDLQIARQAGGRQHRRATWYVVVPRPVGLSDGKRRRGSWKATLPEAGLAERVPGHVSGDVASLAHADSSIRAHDIFEGDDAQQLLNVGAMHNRQDRPFSDHTKSCVQRMIRMKIRKFLG